MSSEDSMISADKRCLVHWSSIVLLVALTVGCGSSVGSDDGESDPISVHTDGSYDAAGAKPDAGPPSPDTDGTNVDGATACPDGPAFSYTSDDPGAEVCDGTISCQPGERPFHTECGCGCVSWCRQAAPGPGAETEVPLQISRAHAAVRFFAPTGGYQKADRALATSLGATSTSERRSRYAAPLTSVCARETTSRSRLKPASTRIQHGVTWVRPGRGTPEVDAEVERVVLDLRDLPRRPETEAALRRATRALLANPVDALERRRRTHVGLTDEYYSRRNIYRNQTARVEGTDWPGEAETQRQVAVVTGESLAPAAAELAITLRLSERATIVGASVAASVAESRWIGVGRGGIAWRAFDLLREDGARVPDAVSADARYEALEGADGSDEVWTVRDPETLPAQRPRIRAAEPFGERREVRTETATVRAALVTAHAASSLFFPYFEAVDREAFDQRFMEAWQRAGGGEIDRPKARRLVRYLGVGLHDGHQGVVDYGRGSTGVLPVWIDVLDGELVVRDSAVDAVSPGSVIVEIDGESATAWLENEVDATSGARRAFREYRAAQRISGISAPVTLLLRTPEGETREVTVEPQSRSSYRELVTAGSDRRHGWVDPGRETIYYMNLDGAYAGSDRDITEALREARDADGLILDMRGHPASGSDSIYSPYTLLRRLIPTRFESPAYDIPKRTSLETLSFAQARYDRSFTPLQSTTFHGPIAVLTAPWSVSAAEDFTMTLEQADRATFVGRTTAGTTGSITGLHLPGGFAFQLTGMRARYDGGDRHFGIGTEPDHRVAPSPADIASEAEPVIRKAAEILRRR